MTKDELWMKIAIEEAKLAMKENEIPVGALLVKDGKLIAQAHNQPIKNHDPTAHAEIQVIREAGQFLKNYRLVGSTLYVTLEPCSMCFGAMIHARVDRVVFGASDPKTGVCSSFMEHSSVKIFNHRIIVSGGTLEHECKAILKSFFKLRRN